LPDPGVAQRLLRTANRDNLPGDTQHRAIFDYGKFRQIGTAAGTGLIRVKGEELANVDQQQRRLVRRISFLGRIHLAK
jgi:hypothetical protein